MVTLTKPYTFHSSQMGCPCLFSESQTSTIPDNSTVQLCLTLISVTQWRCQGVIPAKMRIQLFEFVTPVQPPFSPPRNWRSPAPLLATNRVGLPPGSFGLIIRLMDLVRLAQTLGLSFACTTSPRLVKTQLPFWSAHLATELALR